MEMKRIAVDPETFVRLSCARASAEDVVTVFGAAKYSAFVEFFPDKSLSNKPWTGEGLPPVGTVCEVLWNESRMEYLRTKVFGVNEHGQPIHRFDEGPKKYEYQADVLVTTLGNKVFRPLRTPDQIAAHEREATIKEMVYGACGCEPGDGTTTAFILCGLIYDAGYRKQVQP